MRILAPLMMLFLAANVHAQGKNSPGTIRIQLALAGSGSAEKDLESLKRMKDRLKEMEVELVDLRIGTSAHSSASVRYDPEVATKRLLGLTEFLLGNGVRHIVLEPSRVPPADKGRIVGKEKSPFLGKAAFLVLVQTEDKERAYVRNRSENSEWRLSPGDTFKVEVKDEMTLTCKVVRIELREIVLSIGQSYYSFALGSKLADALEEPLSKERIKELKLPPP